MAGSGGFFLYLKKAFLFHWNLLAVGAGTLLGFISGRPDVVLPLVGAGEVLYLAVLSTHPKFRDAVDAQNLKSRESSQEEEAIRKSKMMLSALSYDDRQRYERLRSLCVQLRKIAKGVAGEPEHEVGLIDDMRSSGINKLLWIYLKLLYSKASLEKFFRTIDEREIEGEIEKIKARIEELGPEEEDTPTESKQRKSLIDTLNTSELRLKNYRLAQENYRLIQIELDRLYSKIAGLSELSINRADPDFISREVDSVSASVQQTERAMDELEFITGLTTHDETAPPLLEETTLNKI